ncbi:MAG: sodium:solute symporter family transporter [Bacteroidia bacterium]
MAVLDWVVLLCSLAFITIYGIYKTRKQINTESYLRGNNSIPWYMVGFSVMATQASAITFLSAPGQAFTDGMRFIQFYFGLPLAMIIICITIIPIYHKLKIYTAYEYLESRFDLKTRSLAAFLFLIQRGLAAGLTIYAPAIILSSLLGWNIYFTNVFIGFFVILYTVSGGTKAVSITQQWQMAIILIGMLLAGIYMITMLPENIGLNQAVAAAGKLGKMNIIDLKFDMNNRYNLWSGLIGGLFLQLSYFGTDQSQVARYISGKSIKETRMGLLMNAMIKIPMQFVILFMGILLYVFYLFNQQPVFFNTSEINKVKQSEYSSQYNQVESNFNLVQTQKQSLAKQLTTLKQTEEQRNIATQIKQLENEQKHLKSEAIKIIKQANPSADGNDTNYIFLTFVLKYFPAGLLGLLIAAMFAASMSSTSSELNALAGTFVIDVYKRSLHKNASDKHYLKASKIATLLWGVFAIAVAMFANKLGSLIEAVNQLGSLFYGTILGIFLTGFYIKSIKGSAVFYAAILSQVIIFLLNYFSQIGFLWFNIIGCALVISFSFLIKFINQYSKK